MAGININPMQTSNAYGSFGVSSDGYIQGTALNDPSVRNYLAGGVLASGQSPVWGGVGISERVPNPPPISELGGSIIRATNVTANTAGQLTGFAVFDQNAAMINTPQSPVPLADVGMLVNFYRLKSGARIPVKCDSSLASLEGGVITQQVSWDFTSQMLVPYAPAYNAVSISGATWASTSGGQTTFTVGTDLTSVLTAGDVIDVSGVVSTGGTGEGFNGRFSVVSVGDSTHVTVTQLGASSPGTYSSGGTIAAAGGALDVRVLDVSISNNMTVDYDSVTGFATWNRNDSVAIILI